MVNDRAAGGKTATWPTVSTILTWSACRMWLKSLVPDQINARSPNCAQALLIMAIVSVGIVTFMLPKPK